MESEQFADLEGNIQSEIKAMLGGGGQEPELLPNMAMARSPNDQVDQILQEEENELEAQLGAIRQNPTAISSLYNAVLHQFKALMGGYFGFEYLNRLFQTIHVSDKRREEFLHVSFSLMRALSIYNSTIEIIDPKSIRKKTNRQVFRAVIDLMGHLKPDANESKESVNLDLDFEDLVPRMKRDREYAYEEYFRICQLFEKMEMPIDPLSVVVKIGMGDAVFEAYMSAYRGLQIIIEEINEANGWKKFQISRGDFVEYIYKIYFETIRGDQQTSISEKNMLQMIVFGVCYNVPNETLRSLFKKSADAQWLGWLKESHLTAYEQYWERAYKSFRYKLDEVRAPILRNFNFDAAQHPTVHIEYARMASFDCAFQIMPKDAWITGELAGKVEGQPYPFKYMPDSQVSSVNFLAGGLGCLGAHTEIMTKRGIQSIANLVGKGWFDVFSLDIDGPSYRSAIAFKTGVKIVYEIRLSDGATISASAEHRFMTKDGWKNVDHLAKGDGLIALARDEHTVVSEMQFSRHKPSEQVLLGPMLSQSSSGAKKITSHDSLFELSNFLSSSPVLCKSSFVGKKILQPELFNLLSKPSEQSNERSKSYCQKSPVPTGFCESVYRRRTEKKMPDPESHADLRNTLDAISQGRSIKILESLLSGAPRKTDQQQAETEPNDKFGKRNDEGTGLFRNALHLEQMSQVEGQILLSRFSDCWDEILDRVQWGLLAQRPGKRSQAPADDRGGRLFHDSSQRENNSWWASSNIDYVTIDSVERFGEDETFDIFVPRTNNYFLGNRLLSHNSGKTTALGGLAAITAIKGEAPTLIPLSDNSNWPILAAMPQTRMHGNTSFAFNEKLGIPPEGIPVLILNIVNDVKKELEGEDLTIYDRIIKVDSHWSFELDIPAILKELQKIAGDMGYKKAAGIIAVRNLGRQGNDPRPPNKPFDIEIQNALQVLYSFKKWRQHNQTVPFRIQVDEAAEAGTSTSMMKEQSQMQGVLGSFLRSGRRWQFAVDIATQLPVEVTSQARNLAENIFWSKLTVTSQTARSPLDSLLESLSCKDYEKEAVRMLSKSGVLGRTRLKFWFNRTSQEINLIQSIPAPFMPQVVGMDSIEVFKLCVKAQGKNPDNFLRKDMNVDWEARPGEGHEAEEKEEQEDLRGRDIW